MISSSNNADKICLNVIETDKNSSNDELCNSDCDPIFKGRTGVGEVKNGKCVFFQSLMGMQVCVIMAHDDKHERMYAMLK